MRILVISNLYPPHYLGGYEILCKQVVDRLAERGYELTVLTSTHGVGECDGRHGDVRVVRRLGLDTPFGEPGRVDRLPRLKVGRRNGAITNDLLAEVKPDVVFVWSQLRLTLGPARAAKASGLPVVFTFNDPHAKSYVPAPFGWKPKKLVRWALDRTVFRETTLAGFRLSPSTAISKTVVEDLVEAGVDATDSQVIWQGIPIAGFPCKDSPGERHDPFRLLYVGQLHEYKGVHTLLEAVSMLVHDRGPQAVRLTICGTGDEPYRERLERMTPSGVRVVFRGRVHHDDLPHLYREHDAFVFPSIWREPFGLTHLEAMASGTPVISTTEGGPGEFLRNEENSLTFPRERPDVLTACIERLMADPELARRLAVEARAEVETTFSIERYVDDLEAWLSGNVEGGQSHEDRSHPAAIRQA